MSSVRFSLSCSVIWFVCSFLHSFNILFFGFVCSVLDFLFFLCKNVCFPCKIFCVLCKTLFSM